MPNRAHRQYHDGQILPFRESLLAMLGLAAVVTLVAFDQTVIGTALPTVVAELQGFRYYAWVVSAYLLASVVTIPIFGRLGDYYGRKPFLLASIVVIIISSALCGMATSMPFLVAARAVQGIGGGMLVGTAFACLPELFPDTHLRLRWQVIMTTAFGIANGLGPSLGGLITEWSGWRAIFFVNLPVGLLALGLAWRYLPHLRPLPERDKVQIDWLGAGLIGLSLGALQLCAELLPTRPFGLQASALIAIAVLAFASLIWWERRAANPMLPLAMFRHPTLGPLLLLSAVAGFVMFSLLLYPPLMFQGGFGYSPREAGLLITPLAVCVTIGSILNGRIITRVPCPHYVLCAGFAMLALACLLLSQATRSTSHHILLIIMLVGGLGLGFILPNLMVFGQQTVGPQDLGIATAMLQAIRMVGGMLGTATIGMVVNQTYVNRVGNLLDHADARNWLPRMSDPQALLDKTARELLLTQLHQGGLDGVWMLAQVRGALVGAIHMALAVVLILAMVGIWRAFRLPPITLARAMAARDDKVG